jgi:NDP-sugar pyrophosphorylase family protein
MKALILAAGLGSRLGNYTTAKPKALVCLHCQEILGLLINKLKKNGFDQLLINIHHHGQQIIDYLDRNNHFGVQIQISDERSELLDTGGAILKAHHFFLGNEPVLVHNVDIITEVNLKELYLYHKRTRALATLCVRKRNTARNLIFDTKLTLKGWMNKKTDEFKWVESAITQYNCYAYSGLYYASPQFPDLIESTGKFSIIDTWLALARSNQIKGFLDHSENWFDLGTPEKLKVAEKYLTAIGL